MDKAVVATRGRIMSAQSHTNPPSPTPAAPPPTAIPATLSCYQFCKI